MKQVWILIALVPLAGCLGGLGGDDYERSEARRIQDVQMGVVEHVRQVRLEGTQSGVGTVAGGAIGGVAGSSVGEGKGAAVGAIIGAVAGGVAGATTERAVTRRSGLEITLRLDSGRLVAVTQEDTGEAFSVGERVRLLESGGTARISH